MKRNIEQKLKNLRLRLAAGAIALSGTAVAQEQQALPDNTDTERYEIPAPDFSCHADSDALSLFFIDNVTFEKGEVLYLEAGWEPTYTCLNNSQEKSRRELRQERRRNRRAYRQKAPNSIIVDTVYVKSLHNVVEFSENPYLGAYSTDDKQITMRRFVFDKDSIFKDYDRFANLGAERADTSRINRGFITRLVNRTAEAYENTEEHEGQHAKNDSKGIYFHNLSPQQGGKVNMWDEISAKTKELLKQESRWLKAGGKLGEIDSYFETDFRFYCDAAKAGIIKPHSSKRSDQRIKQSFMINNAARMWQYSYAEIYCDQILDKALEYTGCRGDDKEYRRARDEALTINFEGKTYHFGNYIEQDVKLPEDIEKELTVRTAFLDVKNEKEFSKIKETLRKKALQPANPFLIKKAGDIKFR